MLQRLPVILFLVVFFASETRVMAQPVALGDISFPNTGKAEAQNSFLEGVLLLHNFEYADAARSFRKAQEIDPGFILAYWGEAMTHNHPIWMQQYTNEAEKALQKLGPTSTKRLEKTKDSREKAYLQSVEILFGFDESSIGKSKEERDFLYNESLKKLMETYPDDYEARAFYGLSILGLAHEGRDFRLYMQAAAILTPIWERNREHPGVAHYLIHSYDDPIHAPLGLPMAIAYSDIAPDAAHAQHMTSHIFVAMGMWDDVVSANERASKVQTSRQVELNETTTVCGHYPYWLTYGYLQQSRPNDAAERISICHERVVASPTPSNLWHFAVMKARYIFDTKDWEAEKMWPVDFKNTSNGYVHHRFAEVVSRAILGDTEPAKTFKIELEGMDKTIPENQVYSLQLEGLLAIHDGNEKKGISLLKQAAEFEESLPFDFGPPAFVKPSFELLGEVYLNSGDAEQALKAFRKQLLFTPNRVSALEGLRDSYEMLGNSVKKNEIAKLLIDMRYFIE